MGVGALANTLGITEEEALSFQQMYFKSFEGLEEAFNIAKKQAVEKGWVQICKYTDKRYFFRDFEKMKKAKEEASKFYPEEYRFMNPVERDAFKTKLYEEHPEVKELWKTYATLKGKLERRAVNFKIQGSSAVQIKTALLYFLRDWNEDCIPILSIHDELLGYVKSNYNSNLGSNNEIEIQNNELEKEKTQELVDWAKNNMIKGAMYVCKETPMFAEADWGEFWIH